MMIKKILTRAAIVLSSLSAACTPSIKEPTDTPVTPSVFEWTAPLEYEYMDEDNSQLKKYTKIISQNLEKNEKASPICRLGNLMFYEIKHATKATDAVYTYRSAAVALPDTYFELPNEALFKTFSEAVRSKPDSLEDYVRVRAMVILTTGNPRYLQEPEDAPTWNDQDGHLEIIYYRLRSNGMAAETKEKCVLSVDADQNFTVDCQDASAN
ncbi:MAG: hypothetical protein IKY83_07305 [Proteobacteria bacterium]|nr:hypothetical protein [Pseudomonadota bacterium]